MTKVRIHELAKELGVDAKTLIAALNEMGDPVKTASARLDRREAQNLAEHPVVRARRTERSVLLATEDLVGSETRTTRGAEAQTAELERIAQAETVAPTVKREMEVAPTSTKTMRRQPKRPKSEGLPKKRRRQLENAATRATLSTPVMCDALSRYVGFDVVIKVERALDHGGTIRQTTDWLRSAGAPDNLSRDDVIRIAKEARRLRRRQRSLEEAAVRDVVRDATRPRGTAWIDGSRSTNFYQVSGGLPTLGRRR